MSLGSSRRRRSDLAVSLSLPPGQVARLSSSLCRVESLRRIAWCLLAALVMWAAMGSWMPPFRYQLGDTPSRGIVVNTPFSVEDGEETAKRKRLARAQTLCVYQHDKQPLVQRREALKDSVFKIITAPAFEKLGDDGRATWAQFLSPADQDNPQNFEQLFNDCREGLAQDKDLVKFEKAIQVAIASFERDGLLDGLTHGIEDGSQTAILVHDVGNETAMHRVEVSEVRLAQAGAGLPQRLKREFAAVGFAEKHVDTLSRIVSAWFQTSKLPSTLTLNESATNRARREAEDKVPPAMREYRVGDVLVPAGEPLATTDVLLLRNEYDAFRATLGWNEIFRHSMASFGMYIALYVLCGAHVFVHHPRLLVDSRKLRTLLAVAVVTVTLCAFDAKYEYRAAIIPLVLFGATVAIAYGRELALLLTAAVSLVITLSLGQSLAHFVILVATTSSAVLLLGRVRSRTKLIYVGLAAAVVATSTTLGVGTLVGQTFGWSGMGQTPLSEIDEWIQRSFMLRLTFGSLWYGASAVLAGLLMTGLLPFIEKLFDVQTDISLLEMGDAAHPLLQELVRRAPGTYNHSITVASLAEAAAEAIGANGLLTRVGAYFHDIGKVFKPDYFAENQGSNGNRHDSLVPAMSTLVIIAHVKDGADLARQHGLPQSIIDFIEQHHGTTLVEYFYRQAARQQQEKSDGVEVDETSFRYPGPRPQSKEAAVLMMADAVESASRTLVDPTPSRIEHLVHELAMKRLLDGQFDECSLTLQELHTIEESLVKSLIAVYHARVKYPNQQTA
ncbi:MAG: HD family phosphohydrolase [Pirellulaceae bacterium]